VGARRLVGQLASEMWEFVTGEGEL
jgi:hypothetical protein